MIRTKFEINIIYRKEWALKWAILCFLMMILAYISANFLESKALTIACFAILAASFLFIKQIMRYFSRKATLILDPESIAFDISNIKGNRKQISLSYSFSGIAAYRFQIPTTRFVCFTLYLKSGERRDFSFLKKSIENPPYDIDAIIRIIQTAFQEFNAFNNFSEAIELKPPYFASNKGLFTILVLVILLFTLIILAVSQDKYPGLTILGSILVIGQIISRRYDELNLLNELRGNL